MRVSTVMALWRCVASVLREEEELFPIQRQGMLLGVVVSQQEHQREPFSDAARPCPRPLRALSFLEHGQKLRKLREVEAERLELARWSPRRR